MDVTSAQRTKTSDFNPVFVWDDQHDQDEDSALQRDHQDCNNDEDMQDPNETSVELNGHKGGYNNGLHQNDGNSNRAGLKCPRKPINPADLDSDDELIWSMKQQGYKDEPVRDRLLAEGRTPYDHKTIATRYSRIRRAMAELEEKCLDAEFSDFHEEEDDLLQSAVAAAQGQFEQDLVAASIKRWQNVADTLKKRLNKAKYTKNTAQARYESLQDSTALPPLEKDPDPGVRTARCLHERHQRVMTLRESIDQNKQERLKNDQEKKQAKEAEASRTEMRREERAKKKLETKQLREERKIQHEIQLANKRAREEVRVQRVADKVISSAKSKQAKQDERAARKWTRDQNRAKRLLEIQQKTLENIQAKADEKIAQVTFMEEENKRREVIRRHMRSAGFATVAPTDAGD